MSRKVLALTAIHSDGSSAENSMLTYYPTNPETGAPFAPEDGVWVKILPIAQKRWDDAERRFTHKVKDQFARKLTEEVKWREVQDELIQYAVQGWDGIAARNASTGSYEELKYAEELKTKLPAALKGDLVSFAMTAQSVEVPAESFR